MRYYHGFFLVIFSLLFALGVDAFVQSTQQGRMVAFIICGMIVWCWTRVFIAFRRCR